MSDIPADRRLELIRMVREEQNRNHMTIRRRSSVLYGDTYLHPQTEEGESFSLPHSGLKLRILIAVILFLSFLILERSGTSILGINTQTIFETIGDNTILFDFIEDINYTLED